MYRQLVWAILEVQRSRHGRARKQSAGGSSFTQISFGLLFAVIILRSEKRL